MTLIYHLSPVDLGEDVILIPKIPKTCKELEDVKVKRVCFSSSIKGCIIAHPLLFQKDDNELDNILNWQRDMIVYVADISNINDYKIKCNRDIIQEKLVFDAHITDEIWVLDEVSVYKKGIIRVYNDERAKPIVFEPLVISKKFGKIITAYTFYYEWVEQ